MRLRFRHTPYESDWASDHDSGRLKGELEQGRNGRSEWRYLHIWLSLDTLSEQSFLSVVQALHEPAALSNTLGVRHKQSLTGLVGRILPAISSRTA